MARQKFFFLGPAPKKNAHHWSRQRVNGNTGMVLVRDTSGLGPAGTGSTF